MGFLLDFDLVSTVIQQAARAQVRRCPWVVVEEAEQEAWVACLQALPRYDERRGDLAGYLYRTATQALGRWAWREGSVLSHGTHRTKALAADVLCARAERAALPEEGALDWRGGVDPEALVEARRAEAALQTYLEQLLLEELGPAVWAVLTGTPTAQAAEEFGAPTQALYSATYQARRELREKGLLPQPSRRVA